LSRGEQDFPSSPARPPRDDASERTEEPLTFQAIAPQRPESSSGLQAIRSPRIVRAMVFVEHVKSAQADLTREQIKALAQLMKDIENG